MQKIGNFSHPFMQGDTYKLLGRSFVSNIVLIVAVVSFIPMLLSSGLILDQFSSSHEDKLYAHLTEMVHRHKQDIDKFLNDRINNIQFLSNSCSIENLADESFLQKSLYQLQQVYGNVFEDLGMVNEKGVQEFYAGRLKLEKADYSKSEWFAQAIDNQYFISDVFLGLRSSPHFILSVKNTYKNKVYLLKATINFEAFNLLAENLRFGRTGFAYILNKNGDFQTKPHYDMLPTKKTYQDFLAGGKKVKHGVLIGTFVDPYERNEIIYTADLLKNDEWILVFQQDKSEAFGELIHAQITAGVVIFFGALVIVIANIILIHKVLNRIAEADREKEMMNRQVIEAGKLASVGELAAGIAHEVNNPVAIMVQEAGWIEDLLEEEEFKDTKNLEEFKRALKQVDIQGQRCKDITHKLLSFARKTSPDVEKIQINEMIKEVVAITDIAAYTKIVINTHLDYNLPVIYGSQTEIQQVFLNLINNALHALEKDGGTINITSRHEDQHVLIVVADDGPGIPEANLDRIFDPFYTTKPVGKGSGLGLSICFGIIKKMGGEIDVHSIVEAGTSFEIRLPINSQTKTNSEDAIARRTRVPEVIQGESEFVFNEKIKLLLVDDEVSFVKVLSKRLSRRNIDVTTVHSGAEGIKALRKVDFDVAILDLKMEDMDGIEVLKIFKQMYSDMEIVILSGHESEQAARDGIKFGAYAYLAKPCHFEELINTIKKAATS